MNNRQFFLQPAVCQSMCASAGHPFDSTLFVWRKPVTWWDRQNLVDGCALGFRDDTGVNDVLCPAPTCEEIMLIMGRNPRYWNNLTLEVFDNDVFSVSAFLPNRGKPGATLKEYRDKNPAVAAAKMYLRVDE